VFVLLETLANLWNTADEDETRGSTPSHSPCTLVSRSHVHVLKRRVY